MNPRSVLQQYIKVPRKMENIGATDFILAPSGINALSSNEVNGPVLDPVSLELLTSP
jgi:hypothetical protein